MCEHERCSGVLTLQPPCRLLILATLRCDDCDAPLGELALTSAEANVTRLLGLPRLVAIEDHPPEPSGSVNQ